MEGKFAENIAYSFLGVSVSFCLTSRPNFRIFSKFPSKYEDSVNHLSV